MLIQNKVYRSDVDKIIQSYDWNMFKGKSFLIIGASGMIGSFLIDVLMALNQTNGSNIEIYAMSRNKTHLKNRFTEYLSNSRFHLIQGDVTLPLPATLVTDFIINAASNTHPQAYATDPIGTIMTSLKGTNQVLAHVALHPQTRVLFLSSVEIYGENRGDVETFSENYSGYIDSNTLRAGYPEGKRVGEALCQAYISKYDLDIVIPRICRVFGPTMQASDSKASSQFLKKAINRENIVLKSKGTQYFSYAYVADVVSALLFLLLHGKSGEAYNVAVPGFDLHLKDFAELVAKAVDRQVIFELPESTELSGYSKATKALLNSDKLHELGWSSKFDLETAVQHTIEILRSEQTNAKN